MWSEREQAEVHVFECAQCGNLSGLRAYGWRGYRIDEPESRETPTVAFFCPSCSAAEFDAA